MSNIPTNATFAIRNMETQLSSENSKLSESDRLELIRQLQAVKDEYQAFYSDKVFYRIVVMTLGAAILLIVAAITLLLFNDKNQFDALTSIGSAAVGGLVGLLAPSPMSSR